MKHIIFETNRLMTRKLTAEDLPKLITMQSDPEVMRFITGIPMSPAVTEEKLRRDLTQYEEKEPWITVVAVTLKGTNTFIGTLAIYKEEKSEWQIGYRFLTEYWGKGYGVEVLSAFLKNLSAYSTLKEVRGTADKRNNPSIRVMEKAGMRFIREYFLEEEGLWESEYGITFYRD